MEDGLQMGLQIFYLAGRVEDQEIDIGVRAEFVPPVTAHGKERNPWHRLLVPENE
jgi:hypothetical protein